MADVDVSQLGLRVSAVYGLRGSAPDVQGLPIARVPVWLGRVHLWLLKWYHPDMGIILTPTGPADGVTHGELDQLRENQLSFLPDTVIIRRRAYDEHDFVTSTVDSEVPARISPGSGRFGAIADKLQALNPYVVTLPYDQDVQPTDQLIDIDGRVYEVRAVRAPSSYSTARQLLAELVT